MEEMLMLLRHFKHLLPAYTLATPTILPALQRLSAMGSRSLRIPLIARSKGISCGHKVVDRCVTPFRIRFVERQQSDLKSFHLHDFYLIVQSFLQIALMKWWCCWHTAWSTTSYSSSHVLTWTDSLALSSNDRHMLKRCKTKCEILSFGLMIWDGRNLASAEG